MSNQDQDSLKEKLYVIAQQIARQEGDRKLEKAAKLSQKKIWIAVVIALLIPAGGYVYTQRWKPLLILFGVLFGLGAFAGLAADTEKEAWENGLAIGSFLGPIAAVVDNSLAIHNSRGKIKKLH